MDYIITKNKAFFEKIGEYHYCILEDMILPETIAVDTEDTGLEARKHDMFCIQIGTGSDNYLIKMYDDEYSFYDVIPYIENRILVLHNALFDLGFFYKYNFIPEVVRDTMLSSKILYNGDEENIRNDFGSVMYRELGIKYDKTEQKNISQVKLSTPSSIAYCFQDVDRLVELHDVMYEKIIEGGYEETYLLHCNYIKALAYIEQCGLAISSEKWKEKMKEDLKNASIWKKKIEEYIYNNIPQYREGQLSLFDTEHRITCSVTSPIQMIKIFHILGIETKDKDGKDSINENIISKSKHEFVEMWLNFQEANHRVTTFGDKILQQIENERIYTNFNPMVDTARLSTRRGNINFLNFPADRITRECFVANEGNIMIVCDYSGQETVVGADLSGDRAMTNSIVNNADLHCAFARILYPEIKNLSDDEIKEHHADKRQNAKAPRFAFQYGGNAYTIHMNEGVPLEKANKIERGFKELHSGLYSWGRQVFNTATLLGYIESADGWKLKLPNFKKFKSLEERINSISREQWTMYREGKEEWKKKKEDSKYIVRFQRSYNYYRENRKHVSDFFKLRSEYERLCLNNPVQARSAHQLKRSTYLLFEWIVKSGYFNIVKIDNTVHDEIICECPKEYGEEVRQNLERCMLEGGNYYLSTLTIKASAAIGDNWESAKHQ